MRQRHAWIFAGLTVCYLIILALDLYPGLRGGAGWQWPYALPESWVPVAVLAGLLALYGVGAWMLRRQPVVLALTWTVLMGAVLGVAAVGISAEGDAGFHLFTRTVSPVQTGASALAVRVMADDGVMPTLERWPRVMRDALEMNLIHFTTSPPGQPLLHHYTAQLFDLPALEAVTEPLSQSLRAYQCSDPQVMRYTRGEIVSAGLGMLMPLWAALTALPLFAAAQGITGDKRTALRLVQWWPLVPAALLFAPTWNTFYPLLVTTAFALLLQGLSRRRMILLLFAGLVMGVCTFLNFSVLPAFLLFGLFTLGYWWFEARHAADAPGFLWTVQAGLWFAVGLLPVWAVFAVMTDLTPFDLLAVTFEKHGLLVQREYLPWLILHPYDVFTFSGWPLVVLAITGLVLALPVLRQQEANRRPALIAAAFFLTLLAVNFAGIVQGENARILIFYMPFLLLSSTALFLQDRDRWEAPLFGAQALTVLVMAAVLPVVPLDLNPQPTGPRQDIAGLGDVPFSESGATFRSLAFSGAFALDRYRFIGDPSAQAITFEFNWRGIETAERPYHFELVATAENPTDGVIVSEPFRWQAQGGSYLPTCWREGDSVRDTVVLPLPVISEPVLWSVMLRAIDERTGDVLRIPLPDGTTADSVILGPVRYP